MFVVNLLLILIVLVLVVGLPIFYKILSEARQYQYHVALAVTYNGSDEFWNFHRNINTKIPVVLGQFIEISPHSICVDKLITNSNQTTTIIYNFEAEDIRHSHKYIADLIISGHWKFCPVFDEKLPTEVDKIVKEHNA